MTLLQALCDVKFSQMEENGQQYRRQIDFLTVYIVTPPQSLHISATSNKSGNMYILYGTYTENLGIGIYFGR